MKFFKKNRTNHAGNVYVSNTQTSDSESESLESVQKMKADKIGSIFAPLTSTEEKVLSQKTNFKTIEKRIL
ncbi:MAG: hypothetical protein F3745_09255 [Nitrospinae bacterium]|nr:hypothetical protein [Nitrospinota bacterium]